MANVNFNGPNYGFEVGTNYGDIHNEFPDDKKLLDWCSRYEVDDPISQALDKAKIANPGQWIFSDERFLSWDRNTGRRILWLHGDKGIGKTVLMARLAQELRMRQQPEPEILASYFVDGSGKPDERMLIRAILRQFAEQSRECREYLEKLYKRSSLDTNTALSILQDMTAINQKFVIVVDGLDEHRQGYESVDRLLARITNPNCRFLFSGRPVRNVPKPFVDVGFCDIALANEKEKTCDDLLEFIHHYVQRKLGFLDHIMQSIIVKALKTRANTYALYVTFLTKLVCKAIKEFQPRNVAAFLEEQLERNSDLEKLYGNLLDQINDCRGSFAKISTRQRAHRALIFLSTSDGELSGQEFVDAISWDLQNVSLRPEDIRYACNNFVVRHSKSGKLGFWHASVMDFLSTQPLRWTESGSRTYETSETRDPDTEMSYRHQAMAANCLSRLRRDLPLLSALNPIQYKQFQKKLLYYHFWPYCTWKWPWHIGQAQIKTDEGMNTLLRQELTTFLSDVYLGWQKDLLRMRLSTYGYDLNIRQQWDDVKKCPQVSKSSSKDHPGLDLLAIGCVFGILPIVSHCLMYRYFSMDDSSLRVDSPLFCAMQTWATKSNPIVLIPPSWATYLSAKWANISCLEACLRLSPLEKDLKNRKGYNPIRYAIDEQTQQSQGAVETLLRVCPGLLNISDENFFSPIGLAIEKKDSDILEFLLKCGADADVPCTNNGLASIHKAAVDGNKPALDILLKHCPNLINHRSKEAGFHGLKTGSTPLMAATEYKRHQIIRHLCQIGADANATRKDGRTAWHLALEIEDLISVEILLGYCEVFQDSLDSTLLLAVSKQQESLTETLLKAGARVDGLRHQGSSALMEAVRFGNARLVACLLRYGANVHKLNYAQNSILNIALTTSGVPFVSRYFIMEMLLLKGATRAILPSGRFPSVSSSSENVAGCLNALADGTFDRVNPASFFTDMIRRLERDQKLRRYQGLQPLEATNSFIRDLEQLRSLSRRRIDTAKSLFDIANPQVSE